MRQIIKEENEFMIFILYASLILFIGVLIYLDRVAVKTYRSARPKAQHIQAVLKRMREQTEIIQAEAAKLLEHQQKIQEDLEQTKKSVETAVRAAKQTPEAAKKLFSVLKTQRKKAPSQP
jgi:uncharacterized protein YoxC